MNNNQVQKTNPSKTLYFYSIVLCGHHDTNRNVIFQKPKNTQNHRLSFSEYKNEYNDHIDIIQVWDVPSMEEYENLILTQSHSIDGIFIIYDRSNQDTLICINTWLKLIQFHHNSVKILISTNPNGLPSKCNSSDGKAVADYYKFHFYKMLSAQNNTLEELLKITRTEKYKKSRNLQN